MRKRIFVLFFFFLLALSDRSQASEDFFTRCKKILIKKSIKSYHVNEKKPPPESTPTSKELLVDLKNPSLRNGILTTSEGGVVQNQEIRIQAESIQYIHKVENEKLIHRIEAEKQLLVQYKGQAYVGDELEYDFVTKTGVLYNGKTKSSPWYIAGDQIHLKSDGTFRIKNVSMTTCENSDSTWDIHAQRVEVDKKKMLDVSKVRFRLWKIPTFWLPSFRMSTKKFFSSPLLRYKLVWERGPRTTLRYQFFSWQDLALFARVDWRWKRGFGGALETEYYPDDGRTFFETKNYLATDVIPNNPVVKRRYRLQGAYRTISESTRTTATITWDKYSDIYMPTDFKNEDFEIKTEQKTEALFRHQEDQWVGFLYARPRVHTFETLKQDIPTLYFSSHTFAIPTLKLLNSQRIKCSFLSYAYAHDLHAHLRNFQSGRLEGVEELYRSFAFGPFRLTPLIGAHGILYTENAQNNDPRFLGTLYYGARLSTFFSGAFCHHRHIIEPFFLAKGWVHPSLATEKHYIFSICDGFHELHQMTLGLSNRVYSCSSLRTSFQIDLYAHGFLDEDKTSVAIPKAYLNFEWNLPSIILSQQNAWNFKYHALDHSNLRAGWTVNQDVALAIEFRYRSRFDWRKADHENFILDVTRTQEELLESPLSDRRNTILAKMFFRLHPLWTCSIESHHGWNRLSEGPYHEFKVDLYTLLSSSWRGRISLEHTEKATRFTGSLDLIKK